MGANSIIQVRRGLLSEWSGINPTLKGGELGYETDKKRGKIGDGSTAYLNLPYVIGTGVQSGGGLGTVTDAFKFIQVTGGPIITASGSGSILSVTGVSPLNIVANTGTKTLSFNINELRTTDIINFNTGVRNVVSTELLDGQGINLGYNAIDDILTINTSGVPLFNSDGTLTLTGGLTVQSDTLIQGNLTVAGSSISTNSTNVNIGDNLITVNVSGAVPSGGLRIYRSGTTSPSGFVTMLWNENTDRFIFNGGSGNDDVVQAGTFIGNLSGIVSGILVGTLSGNATSASTIFVSGQDINDISTRILLTPSTTSGNVTVVTDSGLVYNATTNTLTTTSFVGNLVGTGDVSTKSILTPTSTNNKFNIVLASGTGSPGSLFLDTNTLLYNPNTDTLFASTISGVVISGSPSLSLGLPNASYKIQHFNINNCRLDGGSP
jgi:hypothetical protein